MEQQIKIPEKITKRLYVHIGIGGYNFNQIAIYESSREKDTGYAPEFSYKLLKTIDIDIDLSDITITDNDIIITKIKNLNKQKSELQAETELAINKIQFEIDKLTAIEG